ncbi:CPA_1a_G0032000.mRNA.1.CDS.1 [Saccharomyces cerevisiae]|nr:CPA_1a_G0032000.mRNA.1.CDS.1 [Saccharomyces cerevisiae]CAI4580264.1 BBM_1a_G0031410.mRNA.1.CDS.1 [Saccharomyces cerevisiae]CAI7192149.1 BBM_1a_G0031410.mRNA.1.CDS.1 [Saccharomyces cerevisiae]CAI7377975.1 CPA_1a_G0032000.mRNA.1.CDS.1 [Saccharomyces cerevisiae]
MYSKILLYRSNVLFMNFFLFLYVQLVLYFWFSQMSMFLRRHFSKVKRKKRQNLSIYTTKKDPVSF